MQLSAGQDHTSSLYRSAMDALAFIRAFPLLLRAFDCVSQCRHVDAMPYPSQYCLYHDPSHL